jgi:hypothetical protein
MKIEFDFSNVTSVEFGVGLDHDDGAGKTSYFVVPADDEVQMALREMAHATKTILADQDEFSMFEAGEKHGSTEYLYLPLDHDLAAPMKELYEANNLSVDTKALTQHDAIFCYFARLRDSKGRKLVAVRRSIQFKGVLKTQLIWKRLNNDTVTLIKDEVFKLDHDFDLLVDKDHVHIWRPVSYEFLCHLTDAIIKAVPDNVKAIAKELPFVDFTGIQAYAAGGKARAARLLSSIRSQKEMKDVDKKALKALCDATEVAYKEVGNKLTIKDQDVLGFLEVLDRRRYFVELVKGKQEQYVANSRRRLK